MGVLAEYVKKEAEQLKAEVGKQEAARTEWLSALQKLRQQLTEWVHAADGGLGLLRTSSRLLTFHEPRLGVYETEVLGVRLGSRGAEVVPRARHVVATIRPPGKEPLRADGMVEIRGGAVADYYLFRLVENGTDRWYIQSVGRWNSDPEYGLVDELDRDRFEQAILFILK